MHRSWYDGIGFVVVPGPSTALLGGVALLGLLRDRRQQTPTRGTNRKKRVPFSKSLVPAVRFNY